MEIHQTKIVQLILRIGLSATFAGHGLLAINKFEGWLQFFTCVGISNNVATWLLPTIGYLDMLIALLLLFKPHKTVFFWALGWLLLVALIRPLCGESWGELIKRGGYIACALGLLVLKVRENITPTTEAQNQ